MAQAFRFDSYGINREDGERVLTGSRVHVDQPWFKEACQLFCAAPDLLAAAKAALDVIPHIASLLSKLSPEWRITSVQDQGDWGHSNVARIENLLRSAIAKAEAQ